MTIVRSGDSVPLWPLPVAAAILLLLAGHVSLLLGIGTGQLAACLPYGPDCHSISATGRVLPARLFFKPVLIVGAVALMAYWWLMARWLRLQGLSGPRPTCIAWLGGAGAICLVPYAAALGEGGDAALLLRRLGAVLGFSLPFLAQLLLSAELRRGPLARPQWLGLARLLWGLVVAMLALGTASALLAAFAWHAHVDDAIEWILALLLNTHVALTARLWRDSVFGLALGSDPPWVDGDRT